MKTLAAVVAVLLAFTAPAIAACTGDCSGDGSVTVDEIIQGVNIALGISLLSRCGQFDIDRSNSVTVDEVVGAVNDALRGCPIYLPGEYGASLDIGGPPARVDFTVAGDGSIAGELDIGPSGVANGSGAGAAIPISGSVDFDSGRFSIVGTIPGPPPIEIDISGTLPSAVGRGSISMRIGSATYSGSFGGGPSATPTPTAPMGTQHTVKVGQENLPFDPEVLEINPGDTVTWMWVGGTHSVRSAPPGLPGQPSCSGDGRFDSGAQSSGTFSYTFTTPGNYEYHCGVGTHCQNFESAVVIVRGTPSPTPTRTATATPPPPATATATATTDVVDGVSRGVLGIFSGEYRNEFGGVFEARLQIVQNGTAQVLVTDLGGFVLGSFGQVTMTAETPTRLSYIKPDPFDMRSLMLELVGPGHLTGTHMIGSVGMPSFTSTLDLQREQ